MQTEAGSANWQLCVRRQLSLSLCLLVGELGNLEYWSLHMHMYKCSSHWTEKSWTVSDSSGLSLGWVRLRSSYQYQKTSHGDWFQGETQKCTMHMHMYIHVITHHWTEKSGTRKTVMCESSLSAALCLLVDGRRGHSYQYWALSLHTLLWTRF